MEKVSAGARVVEALGPNTAFMYLYRDADNYKNTGVVVFRGRPYAGDAAGLDQLAGAADHGTYFVPEQVGLRGLQGSWGGRRSGADHAWHELVELGATERPATDPRHINEFVDEFTTKMWGVARGGDAAWVLGL